MADASTTGQRKRRPREVIRKLAGIDWDKIFSSLTFGLEYELVAAGRNLRAKRVPLDSPMSIVAKYKKPIVLAEGVEGAVTEGGESIREIITKAAAICAENIATIPRRMQTATQQFFALHGYHALPVSAVLSGDRKKTKSPRYQKFLDSIGLERVLNTASIQINLGTIENEDLRARAVGLMGNYSHLLLAMFASSPFVERRHNLLSLRRRPNDTTLVDTGIASYHTYQMQQLLAADMPRPCHSKAEYEKARRERQGLYKKFHGKIPKENRNSYDYPLIRMTDFGAELRVTDNIRTAEELELATIMASATWAHVIKRVRDHPDNDPEQTSIQTRRYAHFQAAMSGMEGHLVHPEISDEDVYGDPQRKLGLAYTVVREHLNSCREALELADPIGAESMIQRANKIIDRLERVKTADMRDRAALQWFRSQSGLPLDTPELDDKEGVYLHCFALAEHHFGLFADQQELRETALQWHETALSSGLTPQNLGVELALTG